MCSKWFQSYDEAIIYAQQALSLAEEIGHVRLTTSVHATIGEIYADMGAFSQAEPHLQKSLALARSNQIAYILMYSYLVLGRMRNRQNNPEEAFKLPVYEQQLKQSILGKTLPLWIINPNYPKTEILIETCANQLILSQWGKSASIEMAQELKSHLTEPA